MNSLHYENKKMFGRNFYIITNECAFHETSSGAPNENIVQNHLNIALLNVF